LHATNNIVGEGYAEENAANNKGIVPNNVAFNTDN